MNQGQQDKCSNTRLGQHYSGPGQHYSGPMVDASQVDQQQCGRMAQDTGGQAGNTCGQQQVPNKCNKDFSGPMVSGDQVDQCEERMRHHQTSGSGNMNQQSGL